MIFSFLIEIIAFVKRVVNGSQIYNETINISLCKNIKTFFVDAIL